MHSYLKQDQYGFPPCTKQLLHDRNNRWVTGSPKEGDGRWSFLEQRSAAWQGSGTELLRIANVPCAIRSLDRAKGRECDYSWKGCHQPHKQRATHVMLQTPATTVSDPFEN